MMYSIDALCQVSGYSQNLHYAIGTNYEAISGSLEDDKGNGIDVIVYRDMPSNDITVAEAVFTLAPRRFNQFDALKHPHRLQELIQDAAKASTVVDILRNSLDWQAEFDRMAAEDAA